MAETRRKGLQKISTYGKDIYAAIAALDRALGVLTASPQWVMGSLLGNINFAAWIGVLFESLLAVKDTVLAAPSYERVRIIGEAVKGARDRYRRMTPEERMSKGMETIAKIREIRSKLAEILGPIRDILELAKTAT